jgi:ribosomal protein S12 methylthiotransferase
MLGLLRLEGYEMVRQPDGADFVIVNTCGFLQSARQESLETIREMVRLKRRGRLRGIMVTGCLAERDREALFQECPEIDQLLGLFARDEVTKAADRLIGGLTEQRTIFRPATSRPLPDRDRLRVTPRHLAYLKISEGCDRLCTFCTIPSIRGKHATKPIEEVAAEAEQLASDGVRELNIVAQDTTNYGLDLYGRPCLAELLVRLQQVESIRWIRLLYLYPQNFTDELVDVLASSPKVLPYLDLPLQHINDKILRRMNRRVNRQQTEELLAKLRSRIPGLVLRTTMITGFPGETEEQFQELVDFVRQQRFERLGAFIYSREPSTPSDRLDGHLPEQVRQQRRDRLLEVQQEIAFAWNQAQIGRKLEVLIDRDIPGQANAFVGRSFADAPEIDGVTYITGEGLTPGQIVPSEIVAFEGYDLVGVAVGEPQ